MKPEEISKEYRRTQVTDGSEKWYLEKGVRLEAEFLGSLLLHADFEMDQEQKGALIHIVLNLVNHLATGNVHVVGDDFWDDFYTLMDSFREEK
jgi:hypothetical protein